MTFDLSVLIETWRRRQDLLRAKNRLILQGKAISRRFVDGDKDKGAAAFNAALRFSQAAQGRRIKAVAPDLAPEVFGKGSDGMQAHCQAFYRLLRLGDLLVSVAELGF